MQPALPEHPSGDDPWVSADDVGTFEQGTDFSRWALARYLVGRAIGESVNNTLLVVTVLLLALAAASSWLLHVTFLAVLLVILAVIVLGVRFALRAVLRSLTAVERYGPVEDKLRSLVSDTHKDVLAELRRNGLPGRTVTLPLLAWRLVGRRRATTLKQLRMFEVERAVPRARLDEVHLLLRGAAGNGPRPPVGPRNPGPHPGTMAG
ncbi:MAG TPA: hypothetical protein VGN18_07450 [Jatrophihabitans sp.]|jgi:Zn-dependent protease with chaperone function|nr:hypothetical protein [Jatrophihabitans sp.]